MAGMLRLTSLDPVSDRPTTRRRRTMTGDFFLDLRSPRRRECGQGQAPMHRHGPQENGGPYDDVTPAPYALPKGVPALQHEPARTRRAFIAIGLVAFAAGIGGALVVSGRPASGGGTQPTSERRRWAHAKASGPLRDLITASPTYLVVIQQEGGDDILWAGVTRLLNAATEDTGAHVDALRTRLLERLPTMLPSGAMADDMRQKLSHLESLQRAQTPRKGR